ncbi:protein unc-93 homolog B1 isoform X1 [Erpetoichthys calabaricus]|uniref:protein unc-93 homolog B1 isoform X1 n=2 Tax=Erpetoichthys calabaricus TaxID=27687 RepID=UPI0022345D91|nr:protein unc-93 homolog B1 isoform X1 [Erpetoichthys calabaricus]
MAAPCSGVDGRAIQSVDNIYTEAQLASCNSTDNLVNTQASATGANASELPEIGEAQIDDFLGPNQNYNEEEEERKYFRRKRLAVIKNVLSASIGSMLIYGVYLGLLQMQLILHYDETYREVKYGNLGLQDIDDKMLMGINVTPVVALLYTPVLIRFLGTKWMMFLAAGIYALFVSTNYWERYYTLVPSAVAIGVAIVPFWASMGNYITRMAQKYYEFVNYKQENVQEQRPLPKGACHRYIIIFNSVFYFFFHLSFVCAEMPMVFFLKSYLSNGNHTLFGVKNCGANSVGMIEGLNKTILSSLPRSISLIEVESVLMGVAFISMLMILILCGSAYQPTEEIDLRSIGWGNIFQLPFKHMRDYRLRHLFPFFIYSGFEVLFACTGFALGYGVCVLGLESFSNIIITFGLSASVFSLLSVSLLRLRRHVILLSGALVHVILIIILFIWSPSRGKALNEPFILILAALWGLGSALNKTGLSTLLGMLYEDKERQDFIFTIYHWWQAMAIFVVYLWAGLPMKAKLSIMLVTLIISSLSYWWMERRLAQRDPFRIPRIPRPKHKVKGYRYMEEENSDESDSEKDGEKEGDDGDTSSLVGGEEGGGGLEGQDGHKRRKVAAYEQAQETEEQEEAAVA